MSLKTFATEALNNLSATAAVAPSSRSLAREMVRPLSLRRAKTVVELGPGTGSMTRELLAQLPPDGRLFAFEISSRFSAYLEEKFSDPRLTLVNESAEELGRVLQEHKVEQVDAVVSSLGLTVMPEAVRDRIFETLMQYTHDATRLTQFQYLHGLMLHPHPRNGKLQRYNTGFFLRRYFGSVSWKVVWRNLPPAVVFTCRP